MIIILHSRKKHLHKRPITPLQNIGNHPEVNQENCRTLFPKRQAVGVLRLWGCSMRDNVDGVSDRRKHLCFAPFHTCRSSRIQYKYPGADGESPRPVNLLYGSSGPGRKYPHSPALRNRNKKTANNHRGYSTYPQSPGFVHHCSRYIRHRCKHRGCISRRPWNLRHKVQYECFVLELP